MVGVDLRSGKSNYPRIVGVDSSVGKGISDRTNQLIEVWHYGREFSTRGRLGPGEIKDYGEFHRGI
jgi:hypothetical protein